MFSFQGAFWISFSRNSMKFLIPKELQSISWWRLAGSNRWPPACKAGALPAELNPHILEVVGQNGLAFPRESHGGYNMPPACCQEPPFEPFCSSVQQLCPLRLFHSFTFKKWWAKMDSNHRPHDYQSCALASWAIGPYQLPHLFRYIFLCTL